MKLLQIRNAAVAVDGDAEASECACLSLPGSSFSIPTTQTRLARRRHEKRSLPALHDRNDRCQHFFIGQFLASASEHGPSLCKVHQLFGILPDSTEMMQSR